MASINVKREDKTYAHALQQNAADTDYALDVLRAELLVEKLMSRLDSFKSKDSAIISQGRENKHFLIELFKVEEKPVYNQDDPPKFIKNEPFFVRDVTIEVGVSSEKNITISRPGEGSSTIVYDVKNKLADLRTKLKDVMVDEDLFANKGDVKNTIRKDQEPATTAEDVLDTNGALTVVGSNPSRTISVVKGDEKKSYRVKDETTLDKFRVTLQGDKFMSASDVFTIDTGDLAQTSEAGTKIKDLTGNTLTIKYKSILDGPIPKPKLEPLLDPKVDWSQTITYSTGGGATAPPATKGGTFDGKDEDRWPHLTTEQKRYVYSSLYLGRAVIIGPSGSVGEGKKGELTRSFEDSVLLVFPKGKNYEPLSVASNVGFRSNFLSTFSLTAHELHKKALTTVSAGVGMKGAAFTSEVSVASESTEHQLKSRLYMSQMFCKPVVELKTDVKTDVKPSPKFSLAMWEALDSKGGGIYRYAKLLDVLMRFGHYLPTEFSLGGAYFLEETAIVDKRKNIKMKSFSTQSGLEGTIKGVELKAGGGHKEAEKNENEEQLEERTSDWSVIGGDATVASNTNPEGWLSSLKKHSYWNVIRYGALVPTIRFLDAALLKESLALIKEYATDSLTAEKTCLDMMAYALIAEAALPGDELYE